MGLILGSELGDDDEDDSDLLVKVEDLEEVYGGGGSRELSFYMM